MTSASFTAPAPAAAGRIDILQYFRGLAAIAVVLYHAAQYANLHLGGSPGLATSLSPWAVMGVSMFFALSGFLMARIAVAAEPGHFLLHRLARIYPVFLVIIALYTVLSPVLAGQFRTPRLLAITLVPVGDMAWTLGAVEWTLLFEVTFYLAVFLVILAGATRWLPHMAIAWLAIILVRMQMAPQFDVTLAPTILSLPVSSANVAFACGVIAPTLLARWRVHPLLMLAPLAAILLAPVLAEPGYRAVSGVAAALAVAAAVGAPQGSGWLRRIGLRMGDASYAMYLAHVPVIIAVMRWLPEGLDWRVGWALAVVASVAVGLALGRLDLTLYARLRRRIDALGEARALRLSLLYLAAFSALAAWGAWSSLEDARVTRNAQAAVATAMPTTAMPTTAVPATASPDDHAWTPESVNGRLASAQRAFSQPAGAVEAMTPTPDGKLVFSGWALDRDAPHARTIVQAICASASPGAAKRARLMPAVAAQLDQPGLAKARIAFTLVIDNPAQCPPEAPMVLIAADERGKAWALPWRDERRK